MSQTRRRKLFIEDLEERTLLSGVLVTQTLFGAITITGDHANNRYTVLKTGDNVTITGVQTDVNGVPNGSVSFALALVSEIDITEGNGSNVVQIGNTSGGGFAIPGNINMFAGSGVDNFSIINITTPAGVITFNGTLGAGTGADTVTLLNDLAGKFQMTPGSSSFTNTQTNVTLGFDFITAAANGSGNTVTITNSTFFGPPRSSAISNEQIFIGNAASNGGGDNNVYQDTTNVGQLFWQMGKGRSRYEFSHSTAQQGDIQFGNETTIGGDGNDGGHKLINLNTDTVTGNHWVVRSLNQSGLAGVLENGTLGVAPGGNNVSDTGGAGIRGPVHYTQVNITNFKMTFVGPRSDPMFYVRIDDGDYYYNLGAGRAINAVTGSAAPYSSQVIAGGSFFKATNVDITGLASINLGDHFQNIRLGDAQHHDLNDFDAGQLYLSAGNDLDTVNLDVDAAGQFIGDLPVPFLLPAAETIQLGDNTINPVSAKGVQPLTGTGGLLPLPAVTLFGTVGTPTIGGTMILAPGSNVSVPGDSGDGEPLGWPINVTQIVYGNLFIGASPVGQSHADDGLAINVNKTAVDGLMEISMGSGGLNAFESVALAPITSEDIVIVVRSNPGDTVEIGLTQVLVTDLFGGLQIQDIGRGVDVVDMQNVFVMARLVVLLSDSGANEVSAENVTAYFGFIYGGSGDGNHYHDNGGNDGYLVFGFV